MLVWSTMVLWYELWRLISPAFHLIPAFAYFGLSSSIENINENWSGVETVDNDVSLRDTLRHNSPYQLERCPRYVVTDTDFDMHLIQKVDHANQLRSAFRNSGQLRLPTSPGRSSPSSAVVIGSVAIIAISVYYASIAAAKFFSNLLSLPKRAVCVVAGAITGAGIGAYTGGAAGYIFGACAGSVGGVVSLFAGGVIGAAAGTVTGALAGAVTGSVARRVCFYFDTSPATTTAVTTITSGVGGGCAGAGVVAGVAIAAVNIVPTGSTTAVFAAGFWCWRNHQG